MNRNQIVLASVLLLLASDVSWAEDIYCFYRPLPLTMPADYGIAHVNPDGSGYTMLVTEDDAKSAIAQVLPTVTQVDFIAIDPQGVEGPSLTVDSVNQKLYWTAKYHLPTQTRFVIMRCNHDGSNIGIVPGTEVDGLLSAVAIAQVFAPVPAIGGLGLVMLAGLILCAGGFMARRHRAA